MRVLVVGGGIGGLTTAIALRHQGIEALVLEQAPVLTTRSGPASRSPPMPQSSCANSD